MNIEWKYKIDLNEDAIAGISSKYNVTIPEDLVNLLKKANAATPSKTKFMVKVDEKYLEQFYRLIPERKRLIVLKQLCVSDLKKILFRLE